MKLFTYKRYTTAQKAQIGGRRLLQVVSLQLARIMALDVQNKIAPHLTPERIEEKNGVTIYQASFNLLTPAAEKAILEALKPLQTQDDIPSSQARQIRQDVIAILLQQIDKEPAEAEPVETEEPKLSEEDVLSFQRNHLAAQPQIDPQTIGV